MESKLEHPLDARQSDSMQVDHPPSKRRTEQPATLR